MFCFCLCLCYAVCFCVAVLEHNLHWLTKSTQTWSGRDHPSLTETRQYRRICHGFNRLPFSGLSFFDWMELWRRNRLPAFIGFGGVSGGFWGGVLHDRGHACVRVGIGKQRRMRLISKFGFSSVLTCRRFGGVTLGSQQVNSSLPKIISGTYEGTLAKYLIS